MTTLSERSHPRISDMPRRSSLLRLLLLSAPLLAATPAYAEPSEAERVAARTLLIEGRKKLAAGDAQGSLEFFERAHAIMHVPTTGLDLAKAREALGKLVEAREVALEVTRMPGKAGEPDAFTKARRDATLAVEALDTRIPSIVLRITGVPIQAAKATVDGVSVPAAEIGVVRRLNPGAHEVVVTGPGAPTWKQTVTLLEGQTAPVELQVELSAPRAEPVAVDVAPESEPEKSSWRNAAIWSGAGLAVVGVGVGVGLTVAANGKREQADRQRAELVKDTPSAYYTCGDPNYKRNEGGCAELRTTLRAQDQLTNGAMAGFVVGGVAAVGAVVLLVWPKARPKSTAGARVVPVLGPGQSGVVVSGSF